MTISGHFLFYYTHPNLTYTMSQVRGMGSLLGVELTKDPGAPRTARPWGALGAALKITALEHGLIVRADGAGWFALGVQECVRVYVCVAFWVRVLEY